MDRSRSPEYQHKPFRARRARFSDGPMTPKDPGSGSPGHELHADCHIREAQHKPTGDESPCPLDSLDASSPSAGNEASRDSDLSEDLGLSRENNAPGDNTSAARPVTSTAFISTIELRRSMSGRGIAQKKIQRFLNNPWTETVLGGVITLNFVLILLETDNRACYPGRGIGTKPRWLVDLEGVCLAIFGAELALRIVADGTKFHRKMWNLLDALIVAIGVSDLILSLAGIEMGSLGIVRVLRLCRLLRLLRVLRMFTVLKELRRLIQMMGGCFKTLFWSCLLLFLIMTIWAVIAVELINPTVQQIADEGGWQGCERCRRSFASVFMADITLFQTVVAGDSWGYMAIPVIEKNPPTAIIFIGALMTLVFGVLNLIVAVIVDVFAESRDKDVFARASELEEEEREQKSVLGQIFKRIDTDGGGTLSYNELLQGACKEAEFLRWLRVMDIDSRDLEQLFAIVDEDGNGEIEPGEFIEAMYRMRTADSRTAMKFVKHIVSRIDKQQKDLNGKFEKIVDVEPDTAVSNEIQELNDKLDEVLDVLRDTGSYSGIHELNVKFDNMLGGLLDPGKVEEQLQAVLLQQERHILDTIEVALRKAAEVALEAAKWTATDATPSIGVAGFGHEDSMVLLHINHIPPAAIYEGELAAPQKQVVSLEGPPGPGGLFERLKAISATAQPSHSIHDVPSHAAPQRDDQARGSKPSARS
eukprot:CAMPEP_0204112292 /NCGR_PEP_ID=MMETSP0361-20130328/2960_1 /ASSEMBLY_ACC=CAM_ASM_000343 /TAXON_ID=268821 /ORGANISM="Scrippsiella Hangoei, Strain SHTV-5" /LENGTH=701 /DNA_ID=CAMNT_0051062461 /DNA_START=90 /DNA_END=2195 /DNA_ORIENTATION=+